MSGINLLKCCCSEELEPCTDIWSIILEFGGAFIIEDSLIHSGGCKITFNTLPAFVCSTPPEPSQDNFWGRIVTTIPPGQIGKTLHIDWSNLFACSVNAHMVHYLQLWFNPGGNGVLDYAQNGVSDGCAVTSVGHVGSYDYVWDTDVPTTLEFWMYGLDAHTHGEVKFEVEVWWED
jgi:hypothetical protein